MSQGLDVVVVGWGDERFAQLKQLFAELAAERGEPVAAAIAAAEPG